MLTMRIDGNTVLMTGGSSGIGLALAERFVKLGNIVIICGRREERLKEMAGSQRATSTIRMLFLLLSMPQS